MRHPKYISTMATFPNWKFQSETEKVFGQNVSVFRWKISAFDFSLQQNSNEHPRFCNIWPAVICDHYSFRNSVNWIELYVDMLWDVMLISNNTVELVAVHIRTSKKLYTRKMKLNQWELILLMSGLICPSGQSSAFSSHWFHSELLLCTWCRPEPVSFQKF